LWLVVLRKVFLSGEWFRYHFINILDTPSSNLLQHLPRATKFINCALKSNGTVYIHCVHGQSRSCAVAIAFLMHSQLLHHRRESSQSHPIPSSSFSREFEIENSLHVCSAIVKKARPCMAVNPGFGTQLELYRRMVLIGVVSKRTIKETNNGVVPMVHQSRPHATFRTVRAKSDFTTSGQIPAKFCPVDDSSSKKRHVCNRCNEILIADHNIVLELSSREVARLPASEYWSNSSGGKEYAARNTSSHDSSTPNDGFKMMLKHPETVWKVEPMEWMRSTMINTNNTIDSRGTLVCPKCTQKVGVWDWCYPDLFSCILLLKAKLDVRETMVS